MDDNEYQLKSSAIKISQAGGNTLGRTGGNAVAKKKGWDESDEEVEFLKSHNAKEAKINEAAEEEKRKKDALDEKKNKNLSKYKTNGAVLPSTQMGTQKAEADPVKFTNKDKPDAGSKFKKPPTNGQPVEPSPQPKAENEVKIVKKDHKVQLKWNEEERFNEERQLALAKKAELDREIEAEQRAQEEKKKETQSKIQKAAEKFKPQKKEDAPKPAEPKVEPKPEPKVEAKPEPKAEAPAAPVDAAKKTAKKKTGTVAAKNKAEEAPPKPKLTLAQMKWSDD